MSGGCPDVYGPGAERPHRIDVVPHPEYTEYRCIDCKRSDTRPLSLPCPGYTPDYCNGAELLDSEKPGARPVEIRKTSSTGGQKGVKLGRHSLIPAGPLNALAEHYGMGELKYASHQWRAGYPTEWSYDSLLRHALEWNAGRSHDTCSNANFEGCQHVDTDGNPFKSPREDACYNHTGSHHMMPIAWHAFAIFEFEENFPEHDTRYRSDGGDA